MHYFGRSNESLHFLLIKNISMRKIIFLFAFTVLLISNVNAQTNDFYPKGKIGISGFVPSGGFGAGSFVLSANVRPSFFITDKIDFGVDFGGTVSSGNYYNAFHIKPSFKYFVLDKRISPVVSAGYKFERTYMGGDKTYMLNPTVGLGVSLINKSGNFNIEAGLEYDIRDGSVNRNFNPYISFGFLLNRHKKKETVY